MTDDPQESLLTGGNVTPVVRIGETVRRQTGRQSPTVHALLRHLEKAGIPAPRFLGTDGKGREILSFVEGDTAFPDDLWTTDAALVQSARLLRGLHDASLDFNPADPAIWAFEYPDRSRHDVICHNDFAPYNLVFQAGIPVGIIDFDLCGPGPRLRDLAYLAYWMVPLSFAPGDLHDLSLRELGQRCPRLRLICDTYGAADPRALLPFVSEVLHHMADPVAVEKMVGTEAAARLGSGGHLDHWAGQARAFESRRADLLAALE